MSLRNLNVWVNDLIILETYFNIGSWYQKSVFSWQAMRARLPSYDLRLKKEKRCDKVWNMTWLLLERKLVLEDGLLKKGWPRHKGSKKNCVVRPFPFLPMFRIVTSLYIVAYCCVFIPYRVRGRFLIHWLAFEGHTLLGVYKAFWKLCEHSSTLFFYVVYVCKTGFKMPLITFLGHLFYE